MSCARRTAEASGRWISCNSSRNARRRRRAAEVEAQVSAAAALEAQAVLGLPLGEIVVASFVCREHTTTLGGRLFVTQTRVGFSPCGVGPDHPHDAHGATVAKIEHVTRAWTSEGSGTAAAPCTSRWWRA